MNTNKTIQRSDQLQIKGLLSPGFGSYAASIYRAQLLHIIPGSDIARDVRDWFTAGVRKAIAEPQASLGIGYVVGQKSALPADLIEALQVAGLTHVIVASGYNLTILVRLARRLFVKVSKYLAIFASSAMIVSFIAVTGASPSMTRAGLVAGLSLAAWYYGRRFHPFVLLPFVACLTLVIQPSYAWGDLGWALSFMAFAGVMMMAPLLQAYFFGDKKPGIIRQILGETIAAHIITAPLIIMSFGYISHVAIFANLLILPLVPLAMLLTFIAGMGALLIPAITSIIGLPAQWLLTYMTTIAHYFADLPWAQSEVKISAIFFVIFYLIIIAAGVYMWRVTRLDLRAANLVE